jgi:hypothetical protein
MEVEGIDETNCVQLFLMVRQKLVPFWALQDAQSRIPRVPTVVFRSAGVLRCQSTCCNGLCIHIQRVFDEYPSASGEYEVDGMDLENSIDDGSDIFRSGAIEMETPSTMEVIETRLRTGFYNYQLVERVQEAFLGECTNGFQIKIIESSECKLFDACGIRKLSAIDMACEGGCHFFPWTGHNDAIFRFSSSLAFTY